MLGQVVEKHDPHVILITGDLTEHGTDRQTEFYLDWLRSACHARTVFDVQGNHDLIGQDPEPHRSHLVQVGDVRLAVLAVTATGWVKPRFGRKAFDWIEREAKTHEKSLRLLMSHPHWLPMPGAKDSGAEAVLRPWDRQKLLRNLGRWHIDLGLYGHRHHSGCIQVHSTPDCDRDIGILCCAWKGSHSWHLLDVERCDHGYAIDVFHGRGVAIHRHSRLVLGQFETR
jgi:3',5'-cyclic AMP phosphodiesterase CpdA